MEFPLIIYILLTAVFVVSGVAKLVDSTTLQPVIQVLGIPTRYRAFLRWTVPIAEIVCVVLIAFEQTRHIGATAILVLLATFGAVTWKSIGTGQDISCNCFGSLIPERFGSASYVRQFVLAVITVILLFHRDALDLDMVPFELWLGSGGIAVAIILLYALVSTFSRHFALSKRGG